MKIERYSSDRGFKKGIVFLSGRNQPLTNFNVTSSGKEINLEKMFRDRVQTCLVQFDEEDLNPYQKFKRGEEVEDHLLDNLLDSQIKWLVVASSMGAYFAFRLPRDRLIGIVLIDPIPHLYHPQVRIPVHVHLKLTSDGKADWKFFSHLTAFHDRSAIIIHWNASHLIHWDQPGKIAASIKGLFSGRL